ncbi:MAG: preprotein translocase subunit YajC [Rhodospirillaceae bacterium]
MLISPAYAQSAGGGGMGGFEAFLPLILIFVIFYFLLIRPQQRKMKEHRAMLEAVRRGDRIVTNGGLIGTVTKVQDNGELVVEIAEGVKVKVLRDMLANVLSKSEPAPSDAANDDGKGGESSENASAGSKLKGLFGGGKK